MRCLLAVLAATWLVACDEAVEAEPARDAGADVAPQADAAPPCAGAGGACVVAPCGRPGRLICTEAGVVCQLAAPREEGCDGEDDDCDGRTDEGPDGAPLVEPCPTGEPGRCAAGSRRCAGGQWAVCVPLAARPEICNGEDDDCDGTADEGEPAPIRGDHDDEDHHDASEDGERDDGRDRLACYDGPPGTLGVGICRAGWAVCEAGFEGVCEGAVLPGIEVCPGVDEDCDGRVDEAADQPRRCVVGLGACARPGRLDCAGGQPRCQGEAAPPSPERCNGVDDDCDGVVDPPPVCEVFTSCRAARAAGYTASGVYQIQPGPDLSTFDVWCDQEADGGGWSRVAASRSEPLRPAAGPWHADLGRPQPQEGEARLWGALAHLDTRFDVRLGCEGPRGGVDVVLYASQAYGVWAASECPEPVAHATRDLRTGRWLGREAGAGLLACGAPATLGLEPGGAGGAGWGAVAGRAICGRPLGEGDAVRWWIDVREGSLWRPAGAFAVDDGPNFYFEPEAALVRSCRRHCALTAGLDEPVLAAFACSTVPDHLDRRAALDGYGDLRFCGQETAPDSFVLPGEDAPYECGLPACAYSAFITDHDCAAVNHCFRAFAPPAFRPPSAGSTGTVGADGAAWQVCAADAETAWVAGTGRGRYPAEAICQALGYDRLAAYGASCGEGCGCPPDFDGEGDPQRLEGDVHWRCAR
ncbi:MAG: hypothetical protein H6706_16870 [Myxococcales bacterium]|nr:hypothetical protein [Myxococcales bacterium]